MTSRRLNKPRKRVYEFDATICVESTSTKRAVRKILEHASNGDVAVSLFDRGTLNRKATYSSNGP